MEYKAVLSRSELESLGRTLQRHSKTLEEGNMQQAREEESRKRSTLHAQITINEIQAQLEQNEIRSTKLQQENIELAAKLKKLPKYTLRRKHIDKVLKHEELQQQFMETSLQQTTQLMKEADEKHQRQKEWLFREATELKHRCEEVKYQEAQLKQQNASRDTEGKAPEMIQEQLEKLLRTLQIKGNELREKMKVLKEQVSTKAAGVNTATPEMQPSTASDPQKESNTFSEEGQESSCSLSPSE